MKKILSQKKAHVYIWIGVIILFLIAFRKVTDPVISLYDQNKIINQTISNYESPPGVGSATENNRVEEKIFNKIRYAQYSDSSGLFINTLSSICRMNHTKVVTLPDQIYSSWNKTVSIVTYQIDIEGSFYELINTLRDIELSDACYFVSSSSFKTIYDNRSKKNRLVLTIYMQNIQSDKL